VFPAFCFERSSENFGTLPWQSHQLDFISLAFPKHLSLWNLIVICLEPLLQEPAFLLSFNRKPKVSHCSCFTAGLFHRKLLGCITASSAVVSRD
jgi:hypothetical protein